MTNNNLPKLEICANSFASAKAATIGGAHRVELCENMAEGGTTPSYAQIKFSKSLPNIEIWPIIRPRGGDFLYSDDEFELMKADIQLCKELHCDGVVIGILTANGSIDKKRCAELIALASPMPVAFHRAFDMSNDLAKALEDLIELGIVRVLTSGGCPSAALGTQQIAQLVKQAKGRIEIMPGAGVNAENIQQLRKETGAHNFHSSARAKVNSQMQYRNESTKMGSIDDEYQYEQSAPEKVKALVEALQSSS